MPKIEPSESQSLIIEGRPDSGLSFVGPFATSDEALFWGEENLSHQEWWWVAPLEPPCRATKFDEEKEMTR